MNARAKRRLARISGLNAPLPVNSKAQIPFCGSPLGDHRFRLRGKQMNVTETLNEGLKRAYEITITGAELEAKVNE